MGGRGDARGEALRRRSGWRFLASYAVRHWASRCGSNLRRLALSAALLAVLFVTATFVPATRFRSLAAEENAAYVLRANGPLSDADVTRIREAAPAARAMGLSTLGAAELASRGRVAEDVDIYLTDAPAAQDLSWFSPALLLEGRALAPGAPGEAVLDWRTARRLHASVGDQVSILSGSGSRSRARASARVVGIYASSRPIEGSGLFGPGPAVDAVLTAQARAMRRQGVRRFARARVLYSDVLVGGRMSSGEAASVEAMLADPRGEVLVLRRLDVLADIRRAHADLLGSVWPRLLTGGILLVYVLLLLREQHARVRRRRRELGTLVALGAAEPKARRLLAVESLAEALLASVAAVAVSRVVVEEGVGVYLPRDASAALLGAFLATAVAVSVAVSFHVARLFRRHPIGRLVAEEV